MKFTFELCNNKKNEFFLKNELLVVDLPTVEEAMCECIKVYPMYDSWYIAKISRPFDDTVDDQLIFDANHFHGFMYTNHNTVSNYQDLIPR